MHSLKPCPFCGGTKFHVNTKAKSYFIKKQAERERRDPSNHLVRCTKCGAKGPLKHSPDEAVAAWNDRATANELLRDALRSNPFFHDDEAEQLVFELAWELEEANLNPGDLVTVNRAKLKAIAERVLTRLAANSKQEN